MLQTIKLWKVNDFARYVYLNKIPLDTPTVYIHFLLKYYFIKELAQLNLKYFM